MGKIVNNFIYNIVYQIFILIVPIITAPYLTRVLGATNLGTYSYISSYASIISNLTLLGIYNYGVRQLAYTRDDKIKFNSNFWDIIILRVGMTLIGSIFYFLLSNVEFKYYILIYFPWLLAGYADLSWVFVAVEDMKWCVLKNFMAKIITVVGIFVWVRTSEDTWKYIALLSFSTLFANLSLLPQIKKYIGLPQINFKNLKQHLKGTIILFLPSMASLIYLQIDKIMIEAITGAMDEISFYDQAEKIVKIPMTFITVLSTVMMPRMANEFAKGHTQKIKAYMSKIGSFSLAISLPMIVGLMSVSKQFIPWYLGNDYTPTAIAIIIIAPMILSNALAGISGSQYFVATNQLNVVIWSNVSAAILNILANAILIPRYGYIGSAIASIFASYKIVVIQYVRLSKEIEIKELLHDFPRYLVTASMMGAVIFILTRHMPASALTTFTQIIIGLLTYGILLLLEKDTFLKDVLLILKNRIRKK